jgi:hypothetical protein
MLLYPAHERETLECHLYPCFFGVAEDGWGHIIINSSSGTVFDIFWLHYEGDVAGDGACCGHRITGERWITKITARHAGRVKAIDEGETTKRVVVTGI